MGPLNCQSSAVPGSMYLSMDVMFKCAILKPFRVPGKSLGIYIKFKCEIAVYVELYVKVGGVPTYFGNDSS